MTVSACSFAAVVLESFGMINVRPKSMFSWGFRAESEALGDAVLAYNWGSENGSILIGDTEYDIRKDGPLSGRWNLSNSASIQATAMKPSAMRRAFEVTSPSVSFELRAESAFTRSFEIVHRGAIVGKISPNTAFTRKSTIRCDSVVSEDLQLFAFWLVGLCWRRAQSSG